MRQIGKDSDWRGVGPGRRRSSEQEQSWAPSSSSSTVVRHWNMEQFEAGGSLVSSLVVLQANTSRTTILHGCLELVHVQMMREGEPGSGCNLQKGQISFQKARDYDRRVHMGSRHRACMSTIWPSNDQTEDKRFERYTYLSKVIRWSSNTLTHHPSKPSVQFSPEERGFVGVGADNGRRWFLMAIQHPFPSIHLHITRTMLFASWLRDIGVLPLHLWASRILQGWLIIFSQLDRCRWNSVIFGNNF